VTVFGIILTWGGHHTAQQDAYYVAQGASTTCKVLQGLPRLQGGRRIACVRSTTGLLQNY